MRKRTGRVIAGAGLTIAVPLLGIASLPPDNWAENIHASQVIRRNYERAGYDPTLYLSYLHIEDDQAIVVGFRNQKRTGKPLRIWQIDEWHGRDKQWSRTRSERVTGTVALNDPYWLNLNDTKHSRLSWTEVNPESQPATVGQFASTQWTERPRGIWKWQWLYQHIVIDYRNSHPKRLSGG